MSEKRRLLVVDPSRVVRATLVKHLSEEFEVREEKDGDSAWQTLVLDASIVGVIAGVHLGRIDGNELLGRLRDNRLRRLADMPFFLIISASEPAENRTAARERGVNDFVVRGMAGAEIRQRVGRLVNWDLQSEVVPTPVAEPRKPAAARRFPPRPAMCRTLCDYLAGRGEHPPSATASLVVFGLEREAEIAERFGSDLAAQLGGKIAQVIADKLGRHDLMGQLDGSAHLVFSPGTSLATATAFAQRVCRAFGEQTTTIGQQRIQLGVSAGIASLPCDQGKTAAQLIDLALNRLALARQQPGGNVVSDDPPATPLAQFDALLSRHIHDSTQIGLAGLQALPLMRLLEQEFHFGLPLKAMEAALKKYQGGQTDPE